MWPWLQVLIGGALGALSRYGVAQFFGSRSAGEFPWAVFSVNVLGCLLIGFLAELYTQSSEWNAYRWLITIGFLGGFTTYSSFGLETFIFLRNKEWSNLVLYVAGTNIAGLIAVFLGFQVSKWII